MGNTSPSLVSRNFRAPGKIILSGEYAVIYGFPGIAIPSSTGIEVVFEEDPALEHVEINWGDSHTDEQWQSFAEKIIGLCQKKHAKLCGRLVIHTKLPLGKGMGSSTALVIALTRALLGENSREAALRIENTVNSGHSGLDFAAIWENAPILFRSGDAPKRFELRPDILREAMLIDTGLPSESTTGLVAWMRGRKTNIEEPLKIIGHCTNQIIEGEPLASVIRDHHAAQVALGVVPPEVCELIAHIERGGGAAKIIGAGSRTGGAGMVLALGNHVAIRSIADRHTMPTLSV